MTSETDIFCAQKIDVIAKALERKIHCSSDILFYIQIITSHKQKSTVTQI